MDRKNKGLILKVIKLIFIFAFLSASAYAGPTWEDMTDANYVGGHRFSPSYLILTPFAVPTLTTGYSLVLMNPTIQGVSEDLNIAGATMLIEGQIPIIQHLVLSVKASAIAAAGLNAISALNYGASTGSRLQLGVLYQLLDTPKLALTGGLTVGKPKLYSVSPLVSAGESLNNLFQGTSSDLNFVTESTQWYPSIRAAYTINPTFGLQGNIGAQFFSAAANQDARSQLTFGISFDTQLKPETNVPIAISLIYVRNQVLTRTGAQDTNAYAFSIFETFSPRFNFGTESGWITIPDRTAFSFGFLARYYY